MTSEYKQAMYSFWLNAFKYYNRPISGMDEIIEEYISDLQNYPLEAIKEAFRRYRMDPENKFVPTPAQLKQILTPGYGQAVHRGPIDPSPPSWADDPDVDDEGNPFTPEIREENLRKIKKILNDAMAENRKRWRQNCGGGLD